jgi:hypothetical protein
MSTTILGGDFTVYYPSDNGRKQIVWSGGSDGNLYTVNQLYSALQELFDEAGNMTVPVAMSAQTPTNYTVGCIDPSDTTPWFIDDATTQHLQGGAIATSKWTRIVGTQPGIVVLTCTTGTIVYGDVGNAVSSSDSSAGTLLDVQINGTATTLFVRPTDATSANSFATSGATITCNGHTAVTTAAAYSGESLWANIYSLGTLAVDTGNNQVSDLYVYQNGSKVVGWVSGVLATYPWWATGQIDILVKVKVPAGTLFTGNTHSNTTIDSITPNTIGLVVGQLIYGPNIPYNTTITAVNSISSITISQNASTTATVGLSSNVIDAGYVTVYPREYNETFGYFSVQLLSGGRNPIPLATGTDLNNPTGLRQLVISSGTGTFQVGGTIYVGASLATATKKALVTAVSGVTGSQTLTYSLLGNLTDFVNGNTIKGAVSGATGTSGTPVSNPAAANPAGLATPPAVTFAVASADILNGSGPRPYSIQLNCNNNSLATVYEWTKYLTRRSNVTTTNTDGVTGESYIGIDNRLTYTTLTGSAFTAGNKIYQTATGASGVVVTHDTTNKIIALRNSRGTFGMGAVTDGTNSTDATTNVAFVTPVQVDPFGTFAGGKFFFAFGIYPTNYQVGDTQNYQLTDDLGDVQIPPDLVTVQITGLLVGDSAAVYRTTGTGAINKATYSVSGTLSVGATSVVVTTSLSTDEPAAGFVRLVKSDGGGIMEEHRYRYSSWATNTLTLTAAVANTVSSSAAGSGSVLTINLGTAIDTSVQVGDMVLNSTTGDYGYLVQIASTTQILVRTKSGLTSNWVSTNVVEFNQLVTSYSSATDTVYVPIIDSYVATGTLVSNTLTYGANLNFTVLARVRHFDNITPFEQSTTVGSTGLTVAAIRTADTISTNVTI